MIKDQIRMQKKLQRNGIAPEERMKLDHAIQEQLFRSLEYRTCSHLLTYVSFGSEADTTTIIRRAVTDRKAVYIPKVSGTSMDFFQIHHLEGLLLSKFGVPEPEHLERNRFLRKPAEEENPSLFRLMLLPGLAFDRNGNRIGYGAGYYDRYLSNFPENFFYKIALAYDFQIIEAIAAETYDQKADEIVTPSGKIRCKRKSTSIGFK